ncbi:L-rhamnose/proton symporter RhaT [Acidicapsa dinghuensis]|uniref:L-rhamnose/proton symporter RhaT n=1 Tax=Acidicapsa dinghuensis TaxID=2218256 RepID=A0ABW1EMV3_9BACT|nr:L-rhamnose/proton symporter RhaT [Acidicapsa dinghuensis]
MRVSQEVDKKVNNDGFVMGFLLLVVAGVINACFTLPMKFTRKWAWENTWFAWTIFALLVLPFVVTVSTVSKIGELYSSAPAGVLVEVILFGAGWGVAQVLFGLAIDAIGIALTFSLVMGTSAAVGSLVPLLQQHHDSLKTSAGHGVIAGVALMIAGVAVSAVAGKQRERATRVEALPNRRSSLGIVFALLCGLGASFVNFGISFGAPLMQTARSLGASTFASSNAVWLPLMLAGAIPNLLYCLWLLRANKTTSKFSGGGIAYWLLALIMAVFWFGSTVLYGVSITVLGSWGPVFGWPLFMSLIVITASLLGIFTGEWKGSGAAPLRIQWIGVSLLVFAVFCLALSSRLVI